MSFLGVQRLTQNAIIPTLGSSLAAGYDLYSNEAVTIGAGSHGLVGLGISVRLPDGTYGRVAPRSGLAVKRGIAVGAGVIDPDYTGEVKVVLFNHGKHDFEINEGDRIAQLILERCETLPIRELESLEETDRGSGGFGSTGV